METEYIVHEGILYRRLFTKPLLRCIPQEMVQPILEEINEGICGGHPRARALAVKVIHQGYLLVNPSQRFFELCEKVQELLDFG